MDLTRSYCLYHAKIWVDNNRIIRYLGKIADKYRDVLYCGIYNELPMFNLLKERGIS